MTSIIIKKEKLGRTPCEDEGRDVGDTSTSQGMPKISSKPPEEERGGRCILPHYPQKEPTPPTP